MHNKSNQKRIEMECKLKPSATEYFIQPPRTLRKLRISRKLHNELVKRPEDVNSLSRKTLDQFNTYDQQSIKFSGLKRSDSQPIINLPLPTNVCSPLSSRILPQRRLVSPRNIGGTAKDAVAESILPVNVSPRIFSSADFRSPSSLPRTQRTQQQDSELPPPTIGSHISNVGERRKYNESKALLFKVKTKIGRLMKECEDIEESASSSKKLLHQYSKTLFKRFEETENVSKFINRDK